MRVQNSLNGLSIGGDSSDNDTSCKRPKLYIRFNVSNLILVAHNKDLYIL